MIPVAAAIVLKITLVAGLALAATGLLRRSRASVRHALLAAAFAVLLAIPAVQLAGPQWRIALRMLTPPAPAPSGAIVATQVAAALPQPPEGVPHAAGVSLSAALAAAWVAGMLLTLLPVVIGSLRVRSLRRSAVPYTAVNAVVTSLAALAGIRRRVDILLHESAPGPLTCGTQRPAIVLPADARTWSEGDLNRALVHELEHVRRADWIVGTGTRIMCALYWFHPLVWMMWRKLALEAERACDDAVLGRSEPIAYAEQLVVLARRSKAAKSPLLAMASRADLGARIDAVLDGGQRRGRAGKRVVVLTGAAAAAVLVVVAPFTMVAAPQEAGAQNGAVPRFTGATRLVTVDVAVRYSNGQAVEGLRPGDFTISEDGRKQFISVFEFQKPDSQPSYYVIGYYTPNSSTDGAYRKIEVAETAVPSATVSYRTGYYADQAPQPTEAAARQAGRNSDPANRPPIPIDRAEPQYSEQARKAKWGGTVLLDAQVSASGQVTNIKVIRPLGLGLDEKAVEAASKWKFVPAMKDGKPVAAPVQIELNFRLL